MGGIMKRQMREVEWSNQSARYGTAPEHEEITWREDAVLQLNYKLTSNDKVLVDNLEYMFK